MFRFLLLLAPAVLLAGETRYARLGEMDGKVEVQLHAAEPWSAAERNLTLTEMAWLRTGASSRAEVELDEGSALRLGPDSLIEFSDYTKLSTGQRITVLSLDHGVAWFTGEAVRMDALSLAIPGAQILIARGSRIRVEARDTVSRLSVIEGAALFKSAAAEIEIREGQSARVEPGDSSQFALEREVAPMELDRWSEERDKALSTSLSASYLPMRYGVADLDRAGEWVVAPAGAVWKPRVADGWTPFQKGRWRWYDTLGYTWVSDETWGWLPYHYGRWSKRNDLGWIWVPGSQTVFKPGDVYWLYGRQLAGWGPLAPNEEWSPSVAPQQFLAANTTYATFVADARVIDPAGFTTRPAQGAATFALALPSPAMLPSRLTAKRPALRVGATAAIAPVVPGTTADTDALAPPPEQAPPAVVQNPASDAPPVVTPGPPPDPGPPIYYPVPVYTGVVVINPPEHPVYSRPNPNNPRPAQQPTVAPTPQQRPPSRGDNSGNQHLPPAATRPTQPVNSNPPAPPVTVTPPHKLDPPKVGAPPPQGNDRRRIDAPPPPPRVDQPKSDPPKVQVPRPESRPEPRVPKPESKTEPAKPDAPAKDARKQ